jgi:cytidylate kinase
MNLQPSLQHAEAYINIHVSRSGPGYHGRPPGPFVTVSRESGTGVATFANQLAGRLDQVLPGEKPWTVFDANLVETMLKSRELSPRLAAFLPEDKVSDWQSSVGEIVGLHPSLWELIQRTNELMRQLAQAGHVILVGRGANFATAEIAHGVHVRLVAPPEFRACHKARELSLPPEAAEAYNARVDQARRKFVRSVFDADVERPQAYDAVINVARVPLELAVNLAVDLMRHHAPVPAG